MSTTQLRSADLRNALAFAGEVAGCRRATQLHEQFQRLPGLIDADSVIVSSCRAGEVVREVGDPRLYRRELLEAVALNWREHPVLTRDLGRRADGARRISDFVGPREWRRRTLFNDFYRPLGINRELTAQLDWEPSGASSCVSLHRDGRDFSERDRALLELLTPHLRAARERIGAEARLARQAGSATTPGDGDGDAAQLARLLPITRREAEVLTHLATGATNDGIAHALGISRHTAVRHVEHLYAKLGVHTRVAAARLALETLRECGS